MHCFVKARHQALPRMEKRHGLGRIYFRDICGMGPSLEVRDAFIELLDVVVEGCLLLLVSSVRGMKICSPGVGDLYVARGFLRIRDGIAATTVVDMG